MASYGEALAIRDAAIEGLAALLRMRPVGAGVIALDVGGYGLKVVLPHRPDDQPPATFAGIPIEYHVAVSRPELLGGTPSNWRRKSMARRA